MGPSETSSCLPQLCKQCAQGGHVGKPSLRQFGGPQAWGQRAHMRQPVGCVCHSLRNEDCAGLSGKVTHTPPARSGGSSITFLLSPSDKVRGQLKAHARDGADASQEEGEVDLVTGAGGSTPCT